MLGNRCKNAEPVKQVGIIAPASILDKFGRDFALAPVDDLQFHIPPPTKLVDNRLVGEIENTRLPIELICPLAAAEGHGPHANVLLNQLQ